MTNNTEFETAVLNRLSKMDDRLGKMDEFETAVLKRLSKMDDRLSKMDDRLGKMDEFETAVLERLANIDRDVSEIKTILQIEQQVENLKLIARKPTVPVAPVSQAPPPASHPTQIGS